MRNYEWILNINHKATTPYRVPDKHSDFSLLKYEDTNVLRCYGRYSWRPCQAAKILAWKPDLL